jgi:hypothetical protein
MTTKEKLMRKPRMYGSPAIRVVLTMAREEWFYDVVEAVEFVTKNWKEGTELSARVRSGNYWEPVFTITKDGEAYASPVYAELLASAPVKMEIAL